VGREVPPDDLSAEVLALAGLEPGDSVAAEDTSAHPAARWARRIERWLDHAIAVLLAICAITIVWQVFGRYVLGRSPAWGEEVARMSMAWLTMLGTASCLRDGGHIAVTTLVDALPPGPKAVALWLRDLAILATAGVLAWAGVGFALLNHDQESPALEIPMSIPYASLAIGAVLLALMLVLARASGEVGHAKAADW
jgi:TRAP-type C4-dicarboxylate transport system permease small subunit